MRLFKVTLVIAVTFAIIAWLRRNADLGHIARILPFLGGHDPSAAYDVLGGLGLVLLCLWGLARLSRWGQSKGDPGSTSSGTGNSGWFDSRGDDDDL